MRAYDDMICLPHPTSEKHPRMPMASRAAQFSAFAAVAGHGAAIQDTARHSVRRGKGVDLWKRCIVLIDGLTNSH